MMVAETWVSREVWLSVLATRQAERAKNEVAYANQLANLAAHPESLEIFKWVKKAEQALLASRRAVDDIKRRLKAG